MEPNSALVLFSSSLKTRNDDVHFDYRQDSNFFYLTGFEEDESVFIFLPGQKQETIFFVRKKIPEHELWTGFIFGADQAKESFAMDAAFDNSELLQEASVRLKDVNSIYYQLSGNEADKTFFQILDRALQLKGRDRAAFPKIIDSRYLLQNFRLKKDEVERQTLRTSAQIASKAHIEVMKKTKPGVNERFLHGVFKQKIMELGAKDEAYGGIFASGANATTLHYVFNDSVCEEKQLLLVDAGAEYNYYASDITRTYPVNGKFEPLQKELYLRVLETQKTLIQMVQPGQTFKNLNEACVSMLTDHLLEMGILTGIKKQIIDDHEYKKYFPHSVGHWLGLDVHDLGSYVNEKGEERLFEEGMYITIEPGIYIPEDDNSVELGLRGVGIRIEDDVLVTENGHDVLTKDTPKDVEDLEKLIGSAY
jgi:Xaa-Pro aminopeptidase